jgi:hypothetical protein
MKMRSFLVVEKGEQLLIKKIEMELLNIKAMVDNVKMSVLKQNRYVEQLKSENYKINKKNQELLETIKISEQELTNFR